MARPRPYRRKIVLILHLTPVEARALALCLDDDPWEVDKGALTRIKAKLGAEMIRKHEAMVRL